MDSVKCFPCAFERQIVPSRKRRGLCLCVCELLGERRQKPFGVRGEPFGVRGKEHGYIDIEKKEVGAHGHVKFFFRDAGPCFKESHHRRKR